MLLELAVHDLGVIEKARLVFGPGMTALTGETGAGKTFVVEAIALLMGGRADSALVRSGASEAQVEGRFLVSATPEAEEVEVVLTRVVPAEGRSRAYVNGRLATVAALAEWGEQLVDLHGQHAHQSLLAPSAQREALDRFGGIDLEGLGRARATLRGLDAQLAELGGDERARIREIDLLRFQRDELTSAALTGPDEDASLDQEETLLADAVAHREAAAAAVGALTGDDGARDLLASALDALLGRPPFAEEAARLQALNAEVADIAAEVRTAGDQIVDDPSRLDAIRRRRQLLHDLRRKYGPSLADVIAYSAQVDQRLDALERHEERAAELERARVDAEAQVAAEAAEVARLRADAAPHLAERVQAHLRDLAMPHARLTIGVAGGGAADDVEIRLAANPGAPELPLAKAASGGELARTMLALRLVLSAGPPTLVFDEVDAGIGGEAAVALGRSLARLAPAHQVLVVTHLPQVAAFADAHVRVTKLTDEDHTVAEVELLDEEGRVAELTRMLSGQPESRTARDHAEELLETAVDQRRADR